MPAEPVKSRLKEKVKITAYPCRERNGMVWTYMGPETAELPPLPNLEWNLVPAGECAGLDARAGMQLAAGAGRRNRFRACAHFTWPDRFQGQINEWLAKRDLRPTFDCIRQHFGMSIAAKRRLEGERLYWRVNQFMMPFYSLVPPQSKFPDLSGHAWVPMDDNHTLCIFFSYHPSEPLPARTRELFEEGHQGRETGHPSRHAFIKRNATVPYADYWTKFTRENGFQFDYQSQVDTWFSGLPGLWIQDGACQSGIRPIFDRTKEHLGSSDTGIAMTRRLLLEAVNAYRDRGITPSGVTDPDTFMVRAVSLTLPETTSWVDFGRPHMTAKLGAGFGYPL